MASVYGPSLAPVGGSYDVPTTPPLSTTQKVVRAIFIALAAVLAVGAIAGAYILSVPSLMCALIALGINSRSDSYSSRSSVRYPVDTVVFPSDPSVFSWGSRAPLARAPRATSWGFGAPAAAPAAPLYVPGRGIATATLPTDQRSRTSFAGGGGGHSGVAVVRKR